MTDPQNTGPSNLPPVQDNSAPRLRRLGAAIIDGFVLGSVLILVMQQTGLLDLFEEFMRLPPEQQLTHPLMSWGFQFKLALGEFALFALIQGALLQRYGQTIGKRLLGLAIVTLDGQKPELTTLLVNRYMSQMAMGVVPSLGMWLRVIDICMIFRDDKRCLHDHLAGTRVIDLRIPVSPQQSNSLIV